jgi:toxin CptA
MARTVHHLRLTLTIPPSRALAGWLRALAAVLALAAALAPACLVPLPLAAAALALWRAARPARPCRLDVFGPAHPRLTVQLDGAAPQAARLGPGSTLWPRLLVLRLRGPPGVPAAVPVLPDCLAPADFRVLAVGLRWLAARAQAGNSARPPPSNHGDASDDATRL